MIMQLRNKYIQKEFAFLLITLLLLSYLILLFLLSYKVFSAFIMHSYFYFHLLTNNAKLSFPVFLDQYLTLIFVPITIYLWIRVARATLKICKFYNVTSGFVSSLELNTNDNVLIAKNNSDLAFTYGLFRRKIVIAEKLFEILNKSELEAVIYHEEFHKENFDNLKKIIVLFTKEVMVNFPFKYYIFENYNVLTELTADEYVESKLKSRKPIVSALYKLSQFNLNFGPLSISSFNFKNDRVKILVGADMFKTRSFFSLLFFTFLSTLLATAYLRHSNIFVHCVSIVETFKNNF